MFYEPAIMSAGHPAWSAVALCAASPLTARLYHNKSMVAMEWHTIVEKYTHSNSLCAAPTPMNAAAMAKNETELRVCVGD
mmetsp:Transcript_2324/g.4602  ORF Transcript_2324/g.4602 Transcript_2324/m.4602 type:complete len:80 (+) Transcript_2324:1334-1573(+)